MRISKHPTPFILIRARTQDQCDSCDFAIVHVNTEWKSTAQERLNAINNLKENDAFYCAIFWDAPLGYFIESPLLDYKEELNNNDGKGFLYITMELNEISKLNTPATALDTHMLKITNNGFCSYEAYGKYTSKEFWTDSFSLTKLINL